METWGEKLSVWLGRAALAVFAALLVPAVLWGSQAGRKRALVLGILGAGALLLAARPAGRRLAGLGRRRALLILALACAAVKLAWVLAVKVPVEGDYAVFWGYANSLARQEVLDNGRYMALFPHLFGYSVVLSWLVRLLGSHIGAAVGLNVVLSVLSGVLLFFLGKKLLGLEAGCAALVLWTLCPSQTMYNSLVLSEPLYTAGILAALLVSVRAVEKIPTCPRLGGLGAAGGLLLAGVNLVRPVGMIVLLTVGLWAVCLNLPLWRRKWREMLCFLLALGAVYAAAGRLGSAWAQRRIGEAPASVPGYNILVGFNVESKGQWNQADSDHLFQYDSEPGITAPEVQQKMLADAVERITGGGIDFLPLFREKLRIFLGADDTCVGYCSSIRHKAYFRLACNGFYYACALLALAGAGRMWRRRDRSGLFLPLIYTVGLTLAHMLVEVAGRYHYSVLPMLILLACAGLMVEKPGEKQTA